MWHHKNENISQTIVFWLEYNIVKNNNLSLGKKKKKNVI